MFLKPHIFKSLENLFSGHLYKMTFKRKREGVENFKTGFTI